MTTIRALFRGWVVLLAVGACAGPGDEDARVRELLALPPHFELPEIPESNPLTREKIELGRRLFYDPRLSANQTQSCATCHLPELAFSDGLRTPTGSTGQVLARNSQGLANVAWLSSLTWASGALRTLEEQLQIPIRADNPIELGVTDAAREEVLARFESDPEYGMRFSEAFPNSPSGVTINKIVFALASFCRSLVSGQSPYDRYFLGNATALSERAQLGLQLFNGERFECHHCHGTTIFTGAYRDRRVDAGIIRSPMFNTGLYNLGGTGAYPPHDQGLYELTFEDADRGLFRAPSLRNVGLTAPYMHDGSIETLREVVEHYAAGGRQIESGPFAGDGRVSPLKSGLVRGFRATDEEIDAVVEFLEALTDPGFVNNPAHQDPFRE